MAMAMRTYEYTNYFKSVFAGHAKETEAAHNQKKEDLLGFSLLVYIESYLCHSYARVANNFFNLIVLM
jgi:hypothetical protein